MLKARLEFRDFGFKGSCSGISELRVSMLATGFGLRVS